MWNRFEKGKKDVEGNNSVLYLLSLTPPNKEIPHRFNVTNPKGLSFTFYTDIFFVKKKYIIGNTCVQIFTDR